MWKCLVVEFGNCVPFPSVLEPGVLKTCHEFHEFVAVLASEIRYNPGEILEYLGPNGAGKSTTVKMIVGPINPSIGHVLLEGPPIEKQVIDFKTRLS